MAKKAKSTADEPQATNGAPAAAPGQSVAGYFRQMFKENRKLLKERSNEELFRRWLADHPEHTEVPQNVKIGLQNVKNDLRRKLAEKKAQRQDQPAAKPKATPAQPPARRSPAKEAEQLEERIDDCLMLARSMAEAELGEVIALLRSARNAVVRKLSGGGAG